MLGREDEDQQRVVDETSHVVPKHRNRCEYHHCNMTLVALPDRHQHAQNCHQRKTHQEEFPLIRSVDVRPETRGQQKADEVRARHRVAPRCDDLVWLRMMSGADALFEYHRQQRVERHGSKPEGSGVKK